MLGIIHRALHSLIQNIEFVHTVIECPHILFQFSEYHLLDELIETGLIESVTYHDCLLDEVIEKSRELQLVALVPAVLPITDIQLMETDSQPLFIQRRIEEVKLLPFLNQKEG